MSAAELLAELRAAGITLKVADDRILAKPVGSVTAAQRRLLSEYKVELLTLLSTGEAAPLRPRVPTKNTSPRPDGFCTVHRRYLTFAEVHFGGCSWCAAEPAELAGWSGNRRRK